MVLIIYGYITNSKRDQALGLLAFNSSIGRVLHRYREGHGFDSRSSLDVFFFPRLWFQICLSAHIIKIFIFPSDPTFHAMNICEKNSIWIKSDFVMHVLNPENPIFLRSTRAADHSIDMLRVVT